MIGLGTLINAVAILLGGFIGWKSANQLAARHQVAIKGFLAMLTVLVAVRMIWQGLNGTFGQVLGQVGIMLLALVVGNLIGKKLKLQKGLNGLGQWAQQRLAPQTSGQRSWGDGFVTATLLFCVGPMAILGSLEDGLKGDYQTLAVKGLMDGLATMGFVTVFGRGVMLAVIPLVAYQGTLTLCARALSTGLSDPVIDAISATGGLIVLMIPVVILEVRRAPLADYLPALVVAPVLTMWWR